MKRYEGLFLFDNAATRDWAGIETEVRRLCERIGATLLICLKFDERKLQFEIRSRKRGTYVLTYFDAPPDKITALEHDAQLSELILRCIVLRAENLTEQKLAELKAHPADVPLQPMAGDGRRHDDDDHRDHRGDRGDRGPRDYRDRGDRGDRFRRPEEEAPGGGEEAEVPALADE
ncbi:30S ribosomal protein S6 [Phycisphaerae bacterium RAS1]|nr:30S ribosomal protein S6 [Phycisphaerae bacterium RAS1]